MAKGLPAILEEEAAESSWEVASAKEGRYAVRRHAVTRVAIKRGAVKRYLVATLTFILIFQMSRL
jgi:hypothetical protein